MASRVPKREEKVRDHTLYCDDAPFRLELEAWHGALRQALCRRQAASVSPSPICGSAAVFARRRIYESNYRPLRHQVFAHKRVAAHTEALFAKTNIRELQRLFVFLSRLHEALWQLLYNGRKPSLRPMRYSVKRMRDQPSPEHHRRAVQELVVRETEEFLRSLV